MAERYWFVEQYSGGRWHRFPTAYRSRDGAMRKIEGIRDWERRWRDKGDDPGTMKLRIIQRASHGNTTDISY